MSTSKRFLETSTLHYREGLVCTRLIPLPVGHSLETQNAKLLAEGFLIADLQMISAWIESDPETLRGLGEAVIADPSAESTVCADGEIVQVPAHAIHKGILYENGKIDFKVPVSKDQIGTIYILTIVPDQTP